MLVARQITQGYGRHTVLHPLDVDLQAGVTALLGPNGAGKTTLLETLATVRPPSSGRLIVAGQEVSSEATARTARRQIGYLPQRFGFDPGVRVSDFVTYGAWVRDLPSKEWPYAVGEALAYVGLTDDARKKMGKLSGGMRQRAAIAWALVGRPKLVLLDEPTVGLDPQQRLKFRELVSGLTETAVILSTHLTDDVDAICDRVIVMDKGATVFTGSIAELRARDDASLPGHAPIERAYMALLSTEPAR